MITKGLNQPPTREIPLINDSRLWDPWAKWLLQAFQRSARIQGFEVNVTAFPVNAGATDTKTLTVQGLRTNDVIAAVTLDSGDVIITNARVSADNTLQYRAHNPTGAQIVVGAQTVHVLAVAR